jgi:GNAT superfamily N-acetyltransferase
MGGSLWLAKYAEKSVGCAAFRRLEDNACEMKRVYVKPEFRRLGIANQLVQRLISSARRMGYQTMRLETITIVPGAHPLYSSLGFTLCEPYSAIPPSFRPITLFMQLSLAQP